MSNTDQEINVKILKLTDTYIELLFSNIPLPILNAIRRIIQLEVPTLAIDEVIFYENSSPLYDEVISHRLGLIPLRSEEAIRRYRPPEECAKCMETYYAEIPEEEAARPKTSECENCFTYIRGSVENPDTSSELKTFYSGELLSDDPYVQPVYKEIPIVILGPGQKISFDAKARLGRGIEHVKWSPVSVAGVRYVAKIHTEILSEEKFSQAEECVNYCPVNILFFSREERRIISKNDLECILCNQCLKRCPEESIKIIPQENRFILFFESVGQLSVKTILMEALNMLINKIDYLLKQIETEVSKSG
ncbi:MAG: DNA-directed RNA polymerase subunit D [Sulfolobales archaeon]